MDILSSKNKVLSKALTMRIQKYSDLLHDELLYRTSLMSAALHKQTCGGTNPLVYLLESNKEPWWRQERVQKWRRSENVISAGFSTPLLINKDEKHTIKVQLKRASTNLAHLVFACFASFWQPKHRIFKNMSPVSSNIQIAWTAVTHHSFLLLKNINISCVKKYHWWFLFFEYK